jgi:N-acetyl-gamma-glutamyl-phosphate reductase
MKKVAVLGASGYTGREIASLLARHPALELDGFYSAREGEAPPAPELPFDRAIEPLDWKRLARADGAFLCTPHGTSAKLAARCLELGLKVVDLSADFRFEDSAAYARAYGHAHPAPALLKEAVYGLTEHAREHVAAARLVGNPGCYPTAVLLASSRCWPRGSSTCTRRSSPTARAACPAPARARTRGRTSAR